MKRPIRFVLVDVEDIPEPADAGSDWWREPDLCPAAEAGQVEPRSCMFSRLGPNPNRIGPAWECDTCGDRTD